MNIFIHYGSTLSNLHLSTRIHMRTSIHESNDGDRTNGSPNLKRPHNEAFGSESTITQNDISIDGSSAEEPLEDVVREIVTDMFGDQFIQICREFINQHAEPLLKQAIAEKMKELIQVTLPRDLTKIPAKTNGPQKRML